jgi:hypothetical protein
MGTRTARPTVCGLIMTPSSAGVASLAMPIVGTSRAVTAMKERFAAMTDQVAYRYVVKPIRRRSFAGPL